MLPLQVLVGWRTYTCCELRIATSITRKQGNRRVDVPDGTARDPLRKEHCTELKQSRIDPWGAMLT